MLEYECWRTEGRGNEKQFSFQPNSEEVLNGGSTVGKSSLTTTYFEDKSNIITSYNFCKNDKIILAKKIM